MIAFIANRICALNGADLVSQDILRGLLRSGLPLTVVSSDGRESVHGLEAGGKHAGLNWMQPPGCIARPGLGNVRWVGKSISWVRRQLAQWHGARKLRGVSDDGVIVNGFNNHWIFRFVEPRHCRKRVLIVHDSPARFALQDQPPLDWALQRMEVYSHYIFCSERVAREWLELGELAGKQHWSIPNCCREDDVVRVLAEDRARVRERLGLPASRFVVVCPATVQYRKGQDLLVDSFPVLQSAVPHVLLCLVGAPLGDWGKALVESVKRSDYSHQIQVLGPRHDVLEFIYAADAVVLPSRSEAAPLVVLEAMALRTPVLAAAVGGVPDLIENGRSGLLFSLENRHELVEGLAALAGNPERRRYLAANAEDRYWKRFSRDCMVAGYSQAVRRIVAGEQHSPARVSGKRPVRSADRVILGAPR